MVKKQPMHPRAIAAAQRKLDRKAADLSRQRKEEEELYWRDDDKISNRKQARKIQREEKRLEVLVRKEEKKMLLETEMEQLTGNGVGTPQRMTRKEIADNLKKHGHVGSTTGVTINIAHKQVKNKQTTDNSLTQSYEEELWMKDIPPNLNRINDDVTHARGVDEAINLLKQVNYDQKGNSVDRNPEKRQRASYNAYVEREMERLQTEQPTLNYSQKQQIISKSWQRAPENPVYRKCVERGDLEKLL